ncbi:venom acid phosphatase Acph-1 isoform X2 [Helicoverpa armigera]
MEDSAEALADREAFQNQYFSLVSSAREVRRQHSERRASVLKMFRYLVIAYLVALSNVSCGNPITNEVIEEHELVFAMVLNRHGERSPDADELSLSDQQDLILNLTYLEGPEGLTNVGKRRAYQIGKFYRQRYGSQGHKLISNLYLRDEILIRSTDKERTKMTIQVAMAAAYPPEPEQQWDEGLGKVWQPVPYTAVPLSEDYLRYYSNCQYFKTLMAEAKRASLTEEFLPYLDLIPLIQNKTGVDFSTDPLLFETLYDLFRSSIGLGLDLPDWAKPILPRLSEAGRLAYRLYFRTDEMKKIGGGVLLSQFIQAGNDFISGKPVSQPLRSISAHDFNIGALMDVAYVQNDSTIPEYGAVFALELYKSRSTGSYSVLPVYLPKAGESSAHLLRIKGCETSSHCDFDKFKELTKNNLLPEKEFYQLCNIKTEL